ncbi:MAG: short-chain dehydrogenase, partial [Alphaproteobacteria bacterium]|nr:short-chain dehydrogenase [Alphaproteobacteria bacterium]
FTEALITDLRLNAPHIKCSVVMPGHIGTSIASNSLKVQTGNQGDEITPREIELARKRIAARNPQADKIPDEEIRKMILERARRFLEEAPTSAAEAATIILDGVRNERWRILVGRDAELIDGLVRATPEQAYEKDFFTAFAAKAGWTVGR